MPRSAYKNCRWCKGHESEVGPISWTRCCWDCGQQRFRDNIEQMRSHSGPFASHHRRQCVAAWGGLDRDELRELLDALRAQGVEVAP